MVDGCGARHHHMKIAVCISGYQDTDQLARCVASVAPFGWPVVYADGAYKLFLQPGEEWWSDAGDVVQALAPLSAWAMLPAPKSGPWASEADKKTTTARYAVERFGADWLFFLDTDERLEAPAGIEVALKSIADVSAAEWSTVNLYRPELVHAPQGYPLPRLLKWVDGMHFKPPRDFDVYIGDRLLAHPDVVPTDATYAAIPAAVLRIRHEHMSRSEQRLVRSGHYYQRRRAVHGV